MTELIDVSALERENHFLRSEVNFLRGWLSQFLNQKPVRSLNRDQIATMSHAEIKAFLTGSNEPTEAPTVVE